MKTVYIHEIEIVKGEPYDWYKTIPCVIQCCELVEDDDEGLYHYRRACEKCGKEYWSLHCEHDEFQGRPHECIPGLSDHVSGTPCNQDGIVVGEYADATELQQSDDVGNTDATVNP